MDMYGGPDFWEFFIVTFLSYIPDMIGYDNSLSSYGIVGNNAFDGSRRGNSSFGLWCTIGIWGWGIGHPSHTYQINLHGIILAFVYPRLEVVTIPLIWLLVQIHLLYGIL